MQPAIETLSAREQDVLENLAADRTDREIAARLGIRERTVRAHVSRIILKLGVASRVGAAVVFTEWKIRGCLDAAGQTMGVTRMHLKSSCGH
ncbi:regulatory protein, luxR family [Amycolatopsis xylanica]|uniref:Regulatory protein, luxR family n=1 Tax=Amycolatopsis xylanica TaxID=589385 RepID=A0A1H3J6L8_9PSEU|nr:LuxR C-terminal-related transcriptional regulator [Amycolatopsis xylanica]SDY35447.1 regulatory protein, luxR family [Amycolatopsis xylanica]